MASRVQFSPAVVLRTRPLGEADLVVVLLTPDHGKVEAAATKARSSQRRFAGGLSPGMRGTAGLSRGRGALQRLESFEPSAAHGAVGSDLDRFAYVAYLCEITDELVFERQVETELFAALCGALGAVIEGPPQALTLRQYELALLRCLGLLPALGECCVCGDEVPAQDETVAFEGVRGGTLCSRHEEGAPRLPVAAVAALQHLAAGGNPEVLAGAPPAVRRALRDAIAAIIRAQLRRPLRSQAFFAALPQKLEGM